MRGVRGGVSDFDAVSKGRKVSVITREEITLVERMLVKFERRVECVVVPGWRPKIPAFRTKMSRWP
jgi:hypothetical protein